MKIVKADALGCDYKNTIVLSYNKGWNDFGYKTEYIIKYFDENGEIYVTWTRGILGEI